MRCEENQNRMVKELREESASQRLKQYLCYSRVEFLEMFLFCNDLRPKAAQCCAQVTYILIFLKTYKVKLKKSTKNIMLSDSSPTFHWSQFHEL